MFERKIINDPVFGFINIPKGLLYDVVRHPLLQRLNRIKQLGLSSVVYPGAQHTRFQHSLGAFYLMSEAIQQLATKGNFIFDSEAEAVEAAILMHDIGHGPFSHVLENTIVQGVSHEDISLMLMERINKEMNGQLTLAIQIFKDEYPKALPAPTGKRATGYGPPGLPAPRQLLYRSDRRQHWLRPHYQDAGCKG